jgi:AraC-like DNA-binding protein
MAVRRELDKEGLDYKNIQLGEVELATEPSNQQLENLQRSLSSIGFELLDDRKARIVEKIKSIIINLIHRSEDELNMKLSAVLEEKLHMDYHYLTTLFTSVEGVTIEKFTILQRVEKVKELLKYGELNLSEIAYQMGYSSVQHLSQQFKKVTGSTPSQFRELKENNRKPLDKV